MDERVKAIKKYYFDLKYKNNKQKALKEISILTKKLTINNDTNILERVLDTACLIEKNLSLFQSIFKHIDTVFTIIQYLQHFGNIKRMACKAIDEFEEAFLNDFWDALCTLFYLCPDREMQLFLHTAIVEHTHIAENDFYKNIYRNNYKQLSCQTIDMIIFEDSDFHAVVNQLNITGTRINKIWVQKSVQEQFSSLLNKYFKQSLTRLIRVFQTKEELLTPNKDINKISILSIWSEDITGAKSLAASLKRDIVFINTHMDFCGGLVFLPYTRLFAGPLHQFLLSDLNLYENTSESNASKKVAIKTYNLFYNGMWQKPVKGKYWVYNDCLWANATIEDAHKCIQSAEQGFKICSAWSIESKIQALSKLASVLKNNGKDALSNTISTMIKFAYCPEFSLHCLQIGRLEVKITYMPRGIIIINDVDNVKLTLQSMIMSIICGNSVIIMCNRNSHSFVQYCDMILRSQIPPGVINMLLGENIVCPDNNILKVCEIRGTIAYLTREKKIILPRE